MNLLLVCFYCILGLKALGDLKIDPRTIFFFPQLDFFFLLCQAQNISWVEISEIMQYDRWGLKSKKQCSGIWFPNDA